MVEIFKRIRLRIRRILSKKYGDMLSNETVEARYLEAATTFAFMRISKDEFVADLSEKYRQKWEEYEELYAQRGFLTLPIDDFMAYVLHGVPLARVGALRPLGRKPIFYAKIWRKEHA